MALDDLAATIETIKERIVGHRTSLAANEIRTRQVLIDPLLVALGWDVSDPNQVELEYDVRGRRADYALLVDSNPVAVIEAKRLGHQLVDDNTMQVMSYANTAGIDYMVVTNGDEWTMYSVFKRGAIEDRVVMELRIGREASYVNALRSLSLWRANVGSGSEPVVANTPMSSQHFMIDGVSDPDRLREPIVDRPKTSSLDDTNLTSGVNDVWLKLSDTLDTKKGAPRPKHVEFLGGKSVKIEKWVELWTKTAEWVVKNQDVVEEFRFGKNKQMIMKSRDEGFWRPGHELKNGLWIERNLDPRNVVLTTLQLLEYFKIDAGSVKVKFDNHRVT